MRNSERFDKSGLPLRKFFNTSGMPKSMQLKDKLPGMSEEEQLRLYGQRWNAREASHREGDTVWWGLRVTSGRG
ncbi:MAG: hypothetical protein ACLTDS_00660 [Bianqueaceae bacterium]